MILFPTSIRVFHLMVGITKANKILIIGLAEAGMGACKIQQRLRARNVRHSICGIQNVLKNWRRYGICDRKPGSGPSFKRKRIAARRRIEALIDPADINVEGISLRAAAKAVNIPYTTAHRIARKDLGIKLYRKKSVHNVTEVDKEKRVRLCTNLLQNITPRKLTRVFFTDEKMFFIHGKRNSQNDRVWSYALRKKFVPPKRLLSHKYLYDQKVMVFAGVSLNGKSRLTFVDEGATVDSRYYINRILPPALTDCRIQIGDQFIFMQDGAPPHTAIATQEYLLQHAPGFITKNQWPPHSPDLNPMDYGIWQALSQKVYANHNRNIDELKRNITRCWNQLSRRYISSVVRQFRRRLELVVQQQGGIIEHKLI